MTEGEGPCVGRAAERKAVIDAFTSVRHAGARLVVIAGEPGVGKSRLLAEIVRTVRADGSPAWVGRADPCDRRPCGALVEVVRQAVARADPEAIRRTGAGPLGRLLAGEPLTTPSGTGVAEERHRRFESGCDVLEVTTGGGGGGGQALVALDDLQWADHDTFLFARHLLVSRPRCRVCLVLSLRTPDELAPETAHVVDGLTLLPRTTWIALSGLDPRALADLPAVIRLAGLHDRDPSDVARAVHRATAGNPLLANHLLAGADGLELLTHLGAAPAGEPGGAGPRHRDLGTSLPRRLTSVVETFLARLSPSTRSALRLAAAQGLTFDAGLLGATTGRPAWDCLAEAERASMIRPRPDGRWQFRHRVVHAALEHGQSRVRRARRHLRLARAIEKSGVDDSGTAFALARHYSIARSLTGSAPALRYASQAAERAEMLLDFELAAACYRMAADLSPASQAAQFRIRAAGALQSAGEIEASWRELDCAAHLAASDDDLVGQAALAAARSSLRVGEPLPEHLAAVVERAIARVRDESVRQELHTLRSVAATRGRGIAGLIRAGIAEPAALLRAAETAFWLADPEGRAELAPLLGRVDGATPATVATTAGVARWVHVVETGTGSLDEPPEGVPAELAGEASTDPYATWSWWSWTSTRHIAAGRFARAQVTTETMLASTRASSREPALRRLVLATYYGQLAGLESVRAPRLVGTGPYLHLIDPAWTENPVVWEQLHATHAALAGDRRQAEQRLRACCEPVLDGSRRTGSLISQLALLLRIALDIHDEARTHRLARVLGEWSGWHAVYRSGLYLGAVDLALGRAALADAALDKAVDKLGASLDQHRQVGARGWEPASLAHLAVAHRRRGRAGDSRAATAAAKDARRLADRIGIPYIGQILASVA